MIRFLDSEERSLGPGSRELPCLVIIVAGALEDAIADCVPLRRKRGCTSHNNCIIGPFDSSF
jgi:hypothetical protein